MSDIIMSVKKLVKVYGDEVKNEVLRNISFEVRKGEFISIIGPSGSGKSTLLNILGALDIPTEGEVIINNENISLMSDRELAYFRNRNMGFVFQFHHLLPEFTSLENVLMPHWIKGTANDNSQDISSIDRAKDLLSFVDLEGFEDKLITKLSGGQKQRVAVARSLMNKPGIVLADEPTGNLDSETTEKVYNLLRNINNKIDTTFILVTHDKHLAEKADRVIRIVDGMIESDRKK